MNSLANKQIVLGVTGGIAAYKSAELVRCLQRLGARVQVVMTDAAREFITPLTFQALSGYPVHTDLLDPEAEAAMGHIQLARWADLVLIAPATADFIARLRDGRGDDLLTTLCLATGAQIAIAPAMNQGMWHQPGTQENLAAVKQRGVVQFGPGEGEQACGDVGQGRMLEPEQLAQLAAGLFQTGSLAGKKVVITAGPTREAIDPVRYISNHSSGKMGYALAQAAAEAGADTLLISGPTDLPAPERVTRVPVVSAREMHDACLAALDNCQVFIGCAAVADYRPADVAAEKIKKTGADTLQLNLVKNPDIISAVAAANPKPFTVGFAAETSDLEAQAQDKLARKGLDMIVANDVSRTDIGFNADDNAVTILWGKKALGKAWKKEQQLLDQRSKSQLARDLIALIARTLND